MCCRLQSEHVSPLARELLTNLVSVFRRPGSQENEYAMKGNTSRDCRPDIATGVSALPAARAVTAVLVGG